MVTRVTSEYGPSVEPARKSRPLGGDGHIPFTFRIGLPAIATSPTPMPSARRSGRLSGG